MFIFKRITKGGGVNGMACVMLCGMVWCGVVRIFFILEMAGVMGVNDYSSRFFFVRLFFFFSYLSPQALLVLVLIGAGWGGSRISALIFSSIFVLFL